MFDDKQLLDQLVGNGAAGGFAGGLAGGALAKVLSCKKAGEVAASACQAAWPVAMLLPDGSSMVDRQHICVHS